MGGHTLRVLVDSGSEGCIISSRIADALQLRTHARERPVEIFQADGRKLCVADKYVKLRGRLGDCPYKREITCLVAPIGDDVLLGMSWLHPRNAMVDCGNGSLLVTELGKRYRI
ncbi:hypothetical protein IWQ56_006294, partial [Coemansia nantahalensis]